MPILRLTLFGSFEATIGGQPLPRLRSRKGEWLLALLALRRGEEVERSWLAGTLWPDSPQASGFGNLRTSLKDLRRALDTEAGRLQSPSSRTLRLDLTGAEVDVLAFDAALACGDPASLEEAAALYRGPLLEGCSELWAVQERLVREAAYLGALETLADQAQARGDLAATERLRRRAVSVDPLRESAQRALLQVLACGGNYAAALEVYRELRLRLHRELNAAPDPETQRLYAQIREEARGRSDGATGATARRGETTSGLAPSPARPPRQSLRSLPPSPYPTCPRNAGRHNLPLSLTRFIGREPQLSDLDHLLDRHRLVTLTGAGGCGKTRLAREAARRWIENDSASSQSLRHSTCPSTKMTARPPGPGR